jgi:predicted transcriptional regulator
VPEDVLISVEARHVKSILDGTKTVELRRRPIRLTRGARVWIYSKLPRGQIEVLGVVGETVARRPAEIWRQYGHQSGLSLQEFQRYFGDLESGNVIVFREIKHLRSILSLTALRGRLPGFHPPQFFRRLTDGPELCFFRSAVRTEDRSTVADRDSVAKSLRSSATHCIPDGGQPFAGHLPQVENHALEEIRRFEHLRD